MEFLSQFIAVLAVLAALGGGLWLLQRLGLVRITAWRRPARSGRLLELAESVALGPQHSVHLIRVAGQAVLLGTHPGGTTRLGRFPWPQPGPGPGGALP